MKDSEINFHVSLDDKSVPDTITWNATEKPTPGDEYTNAIAISIWDEKQSNTLRMDLWTKEMTVDDMKRFAIDSIGGLATSLENATGDKVMSDEIHALCRKLVKHVKESQKQQS